MSSDSCWSSSGTYTHRLSLDLPLPPFTRSSPDPSFSALAKPHRSSLDCAYSAILRRKPNISSRDFCLLLCLGSGDIGTVFLCRLNSKLRRNGNGGRDDDEDEEEEEEIRSAVEKGERENGGEGGRRWCGISHPTRLVQARPTHRPPATQPASPSIPARHTAPPCIPASQHVPASTSSFRCA